MKKIIAVNCGSSSLKYKVFDEENGAVAEGIVEKIGLKDSIVRHAAYGKEISLSQGVVNHKEAAQTVLDLLLRGEAKAISDIGEILAVGHRVVHGGEYFSEAALIEGDVLGKIEKCAEFAPLHNPANANGIRAFMDAMPGVPNAAVFDTAFHQTLSPKSFLYPLPYEYYENFGVRKYGFHGISHKYVSLRAGELLGKRTEDLRLISCHLGNGASIAAIQNGESIDTSMGFTPLAGIPMGTRSGNIDPAIIPYLMKKLGAGAEEVLDILNKKSGLLGISGISSDLREIEKAYKDGSERAKNAMGIFASHIHNHIGSYAARMCGVDAIVFTAGIGENSAFVRARVLEGLEFMGVYWDPKKNETSEREKIISYPHSPVKVMVIPTNEELMIAKEVRQLILR